MAFKPLILAPNLRKRLMGSCLTSVTFGMPYRRRFNSWLSITQKKPFIYGINPIVLRFLKIGRINMELVSILLTIALFFAALRDERMRIERRLERELIEERNEEKAG